MKTTSSGQHVLFSVRTGNEQSTWGIYFSMNKQGVYLGTSVTFGVAMYNEIYNCDTLGW
uniref:Uncharacterized protein n=1 Tax=Marmota marmota marmota TaxID=9994 RepID=A0A8C5ZRC3_MARMA